MSSDSDSSDCMIIEEENEGTCSTETKPRIFNFGKSQAIKAQKKVMREQKLWPSQSSCSSGSGLELPDLPDDSSSPTPTPAHSNLLANNKAETDDKPLDLSMKK
jgi:hypothetical protein